MKKQIGIIISIFSILILCPYLVTLVWTGKVEGSSKKQEIYSGKTIIDDQYSMSAMDMEDYLIGVVAAQIPADYEEEAIKVQAIIARTYLGNTMKGTEEMAASSLPLPYWDISECKKQWGKDSYAQNYEKIKNAVYSTKGKTLQFQSGNMDPMFHRASVGTTRKGDENHPYLTAVSSGGDVEIEGYLNISIWDPQEFAERLKIEQSDQLAENIQIVERDESGYVKTVQVREQTLSGEAVGQALELPSTCFTIEIFEGKLRVICKGIGHGYGVSQWGASKLAGEGFAAEEILAYYYKNIEIISE